MYARLVLFLVLALAATVVLISVRTMHAADERVSLDIVEAETSAPPLRVGATVLRVFELLNVSWVSSPLDSKPWLASPWGGVDARGTNLSRCVPKSSRVLILGDSWAREHYKALVLASEPSAECNRVGCPRDCYAPTWKRGGATLGGRDPETWCMRHANPKLLYGQREEHVHWMEDRTWRNGSHYCDYLGCGSGRDTEACGYPARDDRGNVAWAFKTYIDFEPEVDGAALEWAAASGVRVVIIDVGRWNERPGYCAPVRPKTWKPIDTWVELVAKVTAAVPHAVLVVAGKQQPPGLAEAMAKAAADKANVIFWGYHSVIGFDESGLEKTELAGKSVELGHGYAGVVQSELAKLTLQLLCALHGVELPAPPSN